MSERKDGVPEIDVNYVAGLARLHLTVEEADQFQKQLGDILAFVDTLSGLEVEGVEPTAHPAPVLDVLREDEAREFRSRMPRETSASGKASDWLTGPSTPAGAPRMIHWASSRSGSPLAKPW